MTSLAMISLAMASFVPTVNPPLPSLLPNASKCRSHRKVSLELPNRNLLHPMQSSYYPTERTPSQVDSRTMHGEDDEWLISFFHYHQNTHRSTVRRSCAKCHRCLLDPKNRYYQSIQTTCPTPVGIFYFRSSKMRMNQLPDSHLQHNGGDTSRLSIP